MDARSKTILAEAFAKSFVVRPPEQLFRPIKDTSGRVTGVQIDYSHPTGSGVWGFKLDWSQHELMICADLEPMSREKAIATLEAIIDAMRAGTWGDRDLRDLIASRGDVAGKGNKDDDGSSSKKSDAKKEKEALDAAEKEAKRIIGIMFPKGDPKKTPVQDETGGGALTTGQILRIELALANFVGPETNPDRDDAGTGTMGTRSSKKSKPNPNDAKSRPIGDDTGTKSELKLKIRPVPNTGYTDPQRYKLFLR